MLSLEISKTAKKNLANIFTYIAQDNQIAATQVIHRIYEIILQLQMFPYIGKLYNRDLRELVETKYKFRIIYRVDEQKNILYIVSVIKNQNTY